MQPSTIRVFVSSTFKDMHSERDYLARFVFPELREKCRLRGLEFIDIDLRWGVTEEEAKRGSALDICLEEIERSRPFFIGLLGERYGWVPLPSRIPAEKWDTLFRKLSSDEKILLNLAFELDGNRYLLKENLPENLEAKIFDLFYKFDFAPFDIPNGIPEEQTDLFSWMNSVSSGHSVTAMEIMHGVLKNPAMKEQAYFYFRKPGFASELPEVFRDQVLSENELAGKKLAGLKDEIVTLYQDLPDNITDGYSCRYSGIKIPWNEAEMALKSQLSESDFKDLKSKAGNDHFIDPVEWATLNKHQIQVILSYGIVSLTDLEQLGKEISTDLWSAIEKQYPATTEQTDHLEQELFAHRLILEEKTRFFIGRESIITQLTDLKTSDGESDLPVFKPLTVLKGEPGSGKSALMAMAIKRLQILYPKAIVVYRFVGVSPESQNIPDILTSVCKQLAKQFNLKFEETELSRHEKLKEQFQLLPGMAAKKSGQPVFIVLDALNQLGPDAEPEKADWLPGQTTNGVAFLVSAIESPILRNLEQRKISLVTAGVLTITEQEEILTGYLARYRKTLTGNQVRTILSKKESDRPLYLQVVAEELRLYPRFEQFNQRIANLPDITSALFSQVFDRLEKDHGKKLVADALCLIHTSLFGLQEKEMVELLARDGEGKLPASVWTPLLRNLTPYLRQGGSSGLFGFMHMQIGLAVENRYLISKEVWVYYNSKLCNYGINLSQVLYGKQVIGDLTNTGKYCAIYSMRAENENKTIKILSDALVKEFDIYNWSSGFNMLTEAWGIYVLSPGNQIQPDSIAKVLRSLNEETRTGEWLIDIAKQKMSFSNLDLLYPFLEKSLIIFQKLNILDRNKIQFEVSLAMSLALNSVWAQFAGDVNRALDFAEQAQKIVQKLANKDPNNADYQAALIDCFSNKGLLLKVKGNLLDSRGFYEQSLEIAQMIANRGVHHENNQRNLASAFKNLGVIENTSGSREQALVYFERALKIFQTLVNEDPNNDDKLNNLAVTLSGIGDIEKAAGNRKQALGYFERALKIIQVLANEDSNNAVKNAELASLLVKIGDIAIKEGDDKQALGYVERALKIFETLSNEDPNNADIKGVLAATLNTMGEIERVAGNRKQALGYYERSLEIFQTLANEDSNNADKKGALAIALIKMGDIERAAGNRKQVLAYYECALKIIQTLANKDPDTEYKNSVLAECLFKIGDFAILEGDFLKALGYFERCVNVLQTLAVADPKNLEKIAPILILMGDITKKLGNSKQALGYYENSLNIFQTLADADTNNEDKQRALSITFNRTGHMARSARDFKRAMACFEQSLKINQALSMADPNNEDKQKALSASYYKISDIVKDFMKKRLKSFKKSLNFRL